ncbi:hypothetical protein [Elizabethkingia miricola]|uniref:Uncharacterized protein n=1 Tax=Elizabethkingia miricola TaxID=172045 RepID=A0ABD5B346_ELIMR|nr:hypothetical protein [Elizabethkingia miricola]MDQ8748352.1 hypothetical protein [Elizabethkingia miricola]
MNTAVNKQLVFGKLKMTIISEFDTERNCWHREEDYYHFKVIGQF